MDRLAELGMYVESVKCYPYRTAMVYNDSRFIELNRYNDAVTALEEELAEASGQPHRDNHTCYLITLKSGKTLAICCSDTWLSIGPGEDLTEKNW